RAKLLLVSGRRILQRYKPLSTTSFTASDPSDRSTNRAQPPPCQPGAFYSNPPSGQPLFSFNPLIYKEFSERTAPEVVRIIGQTFIPSTAFLNIHSDFTEIRAKDFLPALVAPQERAQ